MTEQKPKGSGDVRKRGEKWYEETIRPLVENEGNIGKFVTIDVETGDFEMDADLVKAGQRIRERHPDTEVWCERVGHKSVASFGGSSLTWSVK